MHVLLTVLLKSLAFNANNKYTTNAKNRNKFKNNKYNMDPDPIDLGDKTGSLNKYKL
jgi:hypothetical protein